MISLIAYSKLETTLLRTIGDLVDANDRNEVQQKRIIELATELNAARDEIEALRKDRTDWQKECLKRGFEYVREPDDHYVMADVPEMADLLGMLLGVEVRTKDNDTYEEANSRLNEQVEGLINTIHAQEALRKDAERYRHIRQHSYVEVSCDSPRKNGWKPELLDICVDAAMIKEKSSD